MGRTLLLDSSHRLPIPLAIAFLAISILTGACTCSSPSASDASSLATRLAAALPSATVEDREPEPPFVAECAVILKQPLDHADPEGPQFDQRIVVSEINPDHPVVLITEGYAFGKNYTRELAEVLDANQVRVEHRFFGESKPEDTDWQYLHIDQAVQDYHRIVELFKPLLPGPWVSTGWSKGGQTSLAYRKAFPDDVAATVAYDAPINLAVEDPRIDAFFDTVGTPECRQRLIEFQRTVLSRKDEIMARFEWYARGRGYTYSIGEEKALEYIVLEYPFSFWQYEKIDCTTIPSSRAGADAVLEHLIEVVSFRSYADRSMDSASMYQFVTQLGYYGYVTKNVADLLNSEAYPNSAYAPQDVSMDFDPEPMFELQSWLFTQGHRILYIYGGLDPWSAPAVVAKGDVDARTEFLEDGNHFTFLRSFSEPRQSEMVDLITNWLATPSESVN
ncbi:MAG: peptidase [bacterium]|nr:peptidase [bacterium]